MELENRLFVFVTFRTILLRNMIQRLKTRIVNKYVLRVSPSSKVPVILRRVNLSLLVPLHHQVEERAKAFWGVYSNVLQSSLQVVPHPLTMTMMNQQELLHQRRKRRKKYKFKEQIRMRFFSSLEIWGVLKIKFRSFLVIVVTVVQQYQLFHHWRPLMGRQTGNGM